ncbi:hypothetical protein evm_003343 [Chilo suppressalis]|nr:hypothetical protein evm_003343 [Chilo suppressalis]
MEEAMKLKLCITSTILLLSCVGLTYFVLKKRKKRVDAIDAFKYLTIRTVSNTELCDEVVLELKRRCRTYKMVGFDCEWVTDHGKRKPVALMQLSTHDGYCALFRLCHLKAVPNSLKDFLEDKTIYKVGVVPKDDAKYLLHDYSVTLQSTLDIRHIVTAAGYDPGGLAVLSQSLLGITLDKSWRVRCSDWEAETLSERQVHYAAVDAHVAAKIFVKMINSLSRKNTWNFFNKEIANLSDNIDKLCGHYLDLNFNSKNNKIDDTANGRCTKINKRREKQNTASARTKPLYTNSFLEAPDGELLCTCDYKKAMWYIEKELADLVKESPFTVRLRFEPAARSVGEVGQYYQIAKENCCVVCGNTNSYIKKNVVPREYRRYFPEVMKDHSCHDVLLLCLSCHQRSNMADLDVRLRLAAECDAPLTNRDFTKFTEDHTVKKVKSAARALLHQRDKIPQERCRQLETTILDYFPECDAITPDLLREAADLQAYVENADYAAHGLKVVEHYIRQDGGLLRLESLWRQHFLQRMRPQHMPRLWSVTHNEERLRVRLLDGRLTNEDLKAIGLTHWIKERESLSLTLTKDNG